MDFCDRSAGVVDPRGYHRQSSGELLSAGFDGQRGHHIRHERNVYRAHCDRSDHGMRTDRGCGDRPVDRRHVRQLREQARQENPVHALCGGAVRGVDGPDLLLPGARGIGGKYRVARRDHGAVLHLHDGVLHAVQCAHPGARPQPEGPHGHLDVHFPHIHSRYGDRIFRENDLGGAEERDRLGLLFLRAVGACGFGGHRSRVHASSGVFDP